MISGETIVLANLTNMVKARLALPHGRGSKGLLKRRLALDGFDDYFCADDADDFDSRARVWHADRTEHEGVGEGECAGADADGDGESGNCDRRRAQMPAEHAERESDIADDARQKHGRPSRRTHQSRFAIWQTPDPKADDVDEKAPARLAQAVRGDARVEQLVEIGPDVVAPIAQRACAEQQTRER